MSDTNRFPAESKARPAGVYRVLRSVAPDGPLTTREAGLADHDGGGDWPRCAGVSDAAENCSTRLVAAVRNVQIAGAVHGQREATKVP